MTLTPNVRKFVLAVHLTVSIGWIGAAGAYLALAVAAANRQDVATVRATWIARELVGWYVIVPLAVASLVTGVVIALGTRWGLLRHYWVVFSLVLTSIATVILVERMPTVSDLADKARVADAAALDRLDRDFGHPVIGLVLLLLVLVLNLYKPRGVTRYGQRRINHRAGTARPDGHIPSAAKAGPT